MTVSSLVRNGVSAFASCADALRRWDERAEKRPAVHEGWPKVSPSFREGMLLPKTWGEARTQCCVAAVVPVGAVIQVSD